LTERHLHTCSLVVEASLVLLGRLVKIDASLQIFFSIPCFFVTKMLNRYALELGRSGVILRVDTVEVDDGSVRSQLRGQEYY